MKYALIIGSDRYTDQKLAKLKTPAADSQALARVLKDQSIGSFDEVAPLVNKTEFQVSRAISTFLANKRPEDLVLIYFSGHGVLDDRGRLFLALKDTQTNLLKSTAISSSFLADEMDSCRSKRQILILDCCHSGAFGRGVKAGEQKVITETTFEGNGFGRVVLTASDSTQYALEGDQVIKQTELSLFTHFLLEGLQTGKADINNDGYISLDEWYDYTYTQVLSTTPKQVPHKWSYHQQGDLIIAKNPSWKKKVAGLPTKLSDLLESPYPSVREVAVKELAVLFRSRDSELTELARQALEKLRDDDSRAVSLAVEKVFLEAGLIIETSEKAEREATEQTVREKAEKAAREKLERESAEKSKRDAVENAKRERAERRVYQTGALKDTLSTSLNTLRSAILKTMPFLRIGGIIAIIFALFWVGSWAVPQILSRVPTVHASVTPKVTTPPQIATSSVSPSETLGTIITQTVSPVSGSVPTLTVSVNSDCRAGPGAAYDLVGELSNGNKATIIARYTPGNYWIIKLPDNRQCWLWGQYASVSGDVSRLPEVVPPATPTASLLLTEITDDKGVQMTLVPAGEFTMGSNIFEEEQPVHKVYLDNYYIDQFEVTNSLYRACEEAGICEPPKQEFSVLSTNYYRDPDFDMYPVIFVDWDMAVTYCEDWRGSQLPTEAQWEKAARGADARKYPWGENIDCSHANFWASGASACNGDTTAVGSYEIGASEYGVHDMAGNVWEWVNDSYNALYYGSLPDGYKNPPGPVRNLNFIVIRGGGWDSGINGVRTAYRGYQPHTYYANNVGFRCAKDANP